MGIVIPLCNGYSDALVYCICTLYMFYTCIYTPAAVQIIVHPTKLEFQFKWEFVGFYALKLVDSECKQIVYLFQ